MPCMFILHILNYHMDMFSRQYKRVRERSFEICSLLEKEDYVVQPIADVSPPKWHLGHTTWFFETFILVPHHNSYQLFHPEYHFVFNSYYESLGARVIRTDRGNLSRPTVDDVYKYREYVDQAMISFLADRKDIDGLADLLNLGLNHEEQHQELLWYDIKYILGHNPLLPAYCDNAIERQLTPQTPGWLTIEEGVYDIGHTGDQFHFDNEVCAHKTYLQKTSISTGLVSNKEFLEFIDDGGYQKFQFWHAEGWDWIKQHVITAPLYWHNINGEWQRYGLEGLKPLTLDDPVSHVSYFEAWAFAQWKGLRLPTEFEWEVASKQLEWGQLWEWTESAYLPYPGFKSVPGPIGEYNGKFMISQMVLRGASVATAPGHSRNTYRNFFHPHLRWMYSGIRLAKHE
jgi:ergothioneine biosynthesis protein EgtB